MTATVASAMVTVNNLWYAATASSLPWLLAGVALLIMNGAVAPDRMRRAIRSARRLRPGGGG